MRRWIMVSACLALCVSGTAQKGTAPNGYYPAGYYGDTYTGTVVDAADRKITLEYTTKKKTESFTGVTTEPCRIKASPGTVKELRLNVIPKGSVITVLYETKKTKRADGAQEEQHVIIGFWFNELNGKKSSDSPPVIVCFTGPAFFTGH